MSTKTNQSRWLWNFLLGVTSIGILLSAQLIYLHVKVHTDPTFHSACNINASFNCEAVARSQYAVVAGLPVAAWGMLGYLFLFFFLWIGRDEKRREEFIYGILYFMGIAAVSFSGVFFYISHYIIHSLCIACMGTYAVNLLLFLLILVVVVKEERPFFADLATSSKWLVKNVQYPIIALFAVIAVMAVYPHYWPQSGQKTVERKDITKGEEGDHYWIGAEKPVLTIVEFSDYECPYCRLYHSLVREALNRHPKQIRLVHKHFPLDQHCNPMIKRPFHAKACLFSKAALCAGRQGKFWEMNDYLYRNKHKIAGPETLIQQARAMNLDPKHFQACLKADYTKASILKDIQEGIKKRIRGTPTFFVNGKQFNASMRNFVSKIEELLNKELARRSAEKH